jgi:ABC-type sugar transport system permease subunit
MYGWFQFLPIGELFSNFGLALEKIMSNDLGIIFRNSVMNYFVGFILYSPIQIFVGFAVYKKIKGVQIYIIVLYLPSVIASMVWVLVYRQMIVYAIPALTGSKALSTIFNSISGRGLEVLLLMWVYTAWMNMGGAMMIITGMFARIEHEIVEAAQIDGCNLWKEFWTITFPHYWPVYSIGLFTGVAGLFTGMPPLFEFYGVDAPKDSWTFGFYFYKMVVAGYMESRKDYPEAAAAGLAMTAVVVPLVLTVKRIVEKVDKMEGGAA